MTLYARTILLLYFCFIIECQCSLYDYCVIGAGPAGLQLAYFLHKSNRNYVLFERNNQTGSFFQQFPRRRKLISLNKRYTGEANKEFNLRHDWHSLLSNSWTDAFKFAPYSEENFPNADRLLAYLNDYSQHFNITIKYNTKIHSTNCVQKYYKFGSMRQQKQCSKFELFDQNDYKYECNVLIVTTGLSSPNVPKNLEHIEGYESVSLDPKNYEEKSVLVLGRGNSAFEVSQAIYGATNFVHMVSRSRIRNAFSTHYVGDVRALNNDLLDTYQLKSLDGFLDLDLNLVNLTKIDDKYYLGEPVDVNVSSNLNIRVGYDKVIRCLGFRFDYSLFDTTSMKFSYPAGRLKKYPKISGDYESVDYENLYFAGTIAHSLDFRYSSGGFIHGFRYAIRALHRIIENRYHGVKWPSIVLDYTDLISYAVKRINEASGPYQMFGQLTDIVALNDDNFEYFEEFPLQMLPKFDKLTGKSINSFILINYEYGKNFSGPGKDVFNLDRVTSVPKFADKSNFLHPVLYYFTSLPNLGSMKDESQSTKERSEAILGQAVRRHHVLEDFLTMWTDADMHQLHLRRFLESVLDKNLKTYSNDECLRIHAFFGTYPLNCQIYF